MKILGYDHTEVGYELSNIIGGVGVGIIISNTFILSFRFGLTVSIVCLIFSIYFRNKYKRILHKNSN